MLPAFVYCWGARLLGPASAQVSKFVKHECRGRSFWEEDNSVASLVNITIIPYVNKNSIQWLWTGHGPTTLNPNKTYSRRSVKEMGRQPQTPQLKSLNYFTRTLEQ